MPMVGIEQYRGTDEHTRNPGERGAHHKRHRRDTTHLYPAELRTFPVLRRCLERRAESRFLDEEPQCGHDDSSAKYDDQALYLQRDPSERQDTSGPWHQEPFRLRPEKVERGSLENHEQCHCSHEQVHFRCFPYGIEDNEVDDQAENAQGERGQHQGKPVVHRVRHDHIKSQVRGYHVQMSLGKIGYVENTEYYRKT